jgi:hypothetical protein
LRAIPGKFVAAVANAVSENRNRDFLSIVAVWLLLAVTLVFLARRNTTVPGLYYDEAHCAGMAKDFLTGHPHPHLPGYEVMSFCGRPFPTFVQIYGGAVKSWLLLPSFALFGTSQSVLRLTALGLGLVALLLFMLWTWRWLGRQTALLAGVLLASDPNFFFISVLDWGPVLPSFLCRFACFYFALRWWQISNEPPMPEQERPTRKMGFRGFFYAFLAGFFAGLGFLNKIDFTVLIGGVLLALLCCNAGRLWARRGVLWSPRFAASLALAVVGLLLAAAPMLTHIPTILTMEQPSDGPGEMTEKFDAMFAMYDGSYFYRLMDAGGLFDKMYQTSAPIFAPVGMALIAAAAYLVFRAVKYKTFRSSDGKPAAFLLLAILFITIGVFQMPRAVRIHHMVLVYPFPHLVVALAVTRLLRRRLAAAFFVLLLALQLLALLQTQQLIRQTGGRGWWSDALSAFARTVKDRPDLTIVSLDWGFNEQLVFLTDRPTLAEPFWAGAPPVPASTNCIYLMHSREYALFDFEPSYVEAARRAGWAVVGVQPWRDHEGQVAFYSFRLRRQ